MRKMVKGVLINEMWNAFVSIYSMNAAMALPVFSISPDPSCTAPKCVFWN